MAKNIIIKNNKILKSGHYNNSLACAFSTFFLNDVKDNCLKSLSKLFQMLTALWRKRRWPDFVLLGGISSDSLFLVL